MNFVPRQGGANTKLRFKHKNIIIYRAVSYIGAIPHFVDVDETTLGVDSDKLAEYLERISKRQ